MSGFCSTIAPASTVGLAENDKAAQKKAVGNLGGCVEAFSAFLAQAT